MCLCSARQPGFGPFESCISVELAKSWSSEMVENAVTQRQTLPGAMKATIDCHFSSSSLNLWHLQSECCADDCLDATVCSSILDWKNCDSTDDVVAEHWLPIAWPNANGYGLRSLCPQ